MQIYIKMQQTEMWPLDTHANYNYISLVII